MCESVENCCRICLDVESEHLSILEDETIHLHIKSCLAMTVTPTDYLPKDICMSCVSQLSDFYSLKLNAMFSLEWLESCVQEKLKKSELKSQPVLPLPDSEYNSDSLLEFLNNTANIEEYLNNLGKEDIPSIVNMLDRNNENSMEAINKAAKSLKTPTPKKIEVPTKTNSLKLNMEVDALDSDIEIVNEILRKEAEGVPKKQITKIDYHQKCEKPTKSIMKNSTPSKLATQTASNTAPKIQTKHSNTQMNLVKIHSKPSHLEFSKSATQKCFACKQICSDMQRLSQHLSTCELAQRTCIQCKELFDSRVKMLHHSLIHNTGDANKCNCGKQFHSGEKLLQHHKTCQCDYTTMLSCVFRCKKCKETFNDRYKLYKHAKDHIMIAAKKVCNICSHTFIGEDDLIKHKNEIHGEASNSGLLYRCKVCSHTSPSHQELYTHVQTHLLKQMESVLHLCDTCGKCFKTRPSLLRHSLTHKTDIKKDSDGQTCNGYKLIVNDINTNIVGKNNKIETNGMKKVNNSDSKGTSIDVKANDFKFNNVTRDLFNVKSSPKNTNEQITNDIHFKHDINLSGETKPYSKVKDKSDGITNEKKTNGKEEVKLEIRMCEKCGQNVDISQLDHHFCM